MTMDYKGHERRSAKDRRTVANRRHVRGGFLMSLRLFTDRRAGMDRRAGLDRREGLSKSYQKESIIKISKKSFIKKWDARKAKMTYVWEKGLRAITFNIFKPGQDIEVEITYPDRPRGLFLKARILNTRKIYTEHGFATEIDVQFSDITDNAIAEINNIIWGET